MKAWRGGLLHGVVHSLAPPRAGGQAFACARAWTRIGNWTDRPAYWSRPMYLTILSIGIGAALGALLRWGLGIWLNFLFPAIPPGTVAANLIGAYIIGLAIAYFAHNPAVAPHVRLFIVTGFCGGLTTFSTFSAEIVALLQQERIALALSSIFLHVTGSLVMTTLGMLTYTSLRQA